MKDDETHTQQLLAVSENHKAIMEGDDDRGDHDNGIPNSTSNEQQHGHEKELQYILSCLDEDELETAARTNYQYFMQQQHQQQPTTATVNNTYSNDKHQCAMAMARRYLTSKKQVETALECMKATLKFRQEMDIDGLRQVFDDLQNQPQEQPQAPEQEPIHDEETQSQSQPRPPSQAETKRLKLESMLASRKTYVMGFDRQGRSTYMFIPRQATCHDTVYWTLQESLYTMERALACTRAPTQTVNAVIDFAGFDVWQHAPPLEVAREFLTTLRHHYVGCFDKIFILDAPLGFSLLWNMVQPFVGTSTREKIVLLTGVAEKTSTLSHYYTVEQAAPFMLEGGRKDRVLELREYLYQTPFDKAFDE